MATVQWLLLGGPFNGKVVNVSVGMKAIALEDVGASLDDMPPPDWTARTAKTRTRHEYIQRVYWWNDRDYAVGVHGAATPAQIDVETVGAQLTGLRVRPLR